MRFSWLVIPAIAATLALRLAAGTGALAEDRERALDDVGAMLAERGFTVRLDERDGPDAVIATQGACNMVVAAEPAGFISLGLFRKRYTENRTLAMFYRGGEVAEPPRFQPAVDYYLQRHLGQLGIAISHHPLVLVAASSACEPAAIPWHQLRLHLAPR